jgi:hypothetical protein
MCGKFYLKEEKIKWFTNECDSKDNKFNFYFEDE